MAKLPGLVVRLYLWVLLVQVPHEFVLGEEHRQGLGMYQLELLCPVSRGDVNTLGELEVAALHITEEPPEEGRLAPRLEVTEKLLASHCSLW